MKTLEARLDYELEAVAIGTAVMRQGRDINPPLERLFWIQSCLNEAIAIQQRIEKRNARIERRSA